MESILMDSIRHNDKERIYWTSSINTIDVEKERFF